MFDMFEKADKETESSSITFTSQKVFVLSVGGSVLVDEKPNYKIIEKFSNSINTLSREGYKFVLVVGGGKTARKYIGAAKTLNSNKYFLDEIGIQATRLNAMLLISVIENAFPKVLTDILRGKELLDEGKIPIYGGIIPSFTTDAVAALIAESLNGVFVNLSNVNGIFSEDPKQNPRAKLLPEITYKELLSLIKNNQSQPGQNVVLDLPACLILKRSNLHAFFMNGNDLANFESFIRGQTFKGTTIKPSPEEESEHILKKLSGKKLKKFKKLKENRKTNIDNLMEQSEENEDEEIDVRKLRLD